MKIIKFKKKMVNKKTNHILMQVGVIALCISLVINCVQAYFNITLANQNNADSTSLQNYRDLQNEQIEFVKNRCYGGYAKYGSDGTKDDAFRQMEQIAIYQAPRYINVNSYDFFQDLIFDYLQSICLKPLVLLLGSEDIYGNNLNYFTKWGYFHLDDADFDAVRW